MITPGIRGFSGDYRFLSNFYLEPDGTFIEYEFQRAKCANFKDRETFDSLFRQGKLTPKMAKGIGRRVELRPDWEDVRVSIMLFYVTKKFREHETLWWKLKQTAPLLLEETNTWGDTFWGVCGGKGQNMLGAILMQVRDEM